MRDLPQSYAAAEVEAEAELQDLLWRVDRAARPPLPTAPARAPNNSGGRDMIDPRIDVAAQKSLLRMRANPATRADAAGMLAAVKSGELAGIYGDDLRAAAQLAARLRTVRWELVPKDRDAALIRVPGDPLAAPTIIFREQVRSIPSRLDPALRRAWAGRRPWRGTPVLVELPMLGHTWVDRSVIGANLLAEAQLQLRQPSPLVLLPNTAAVPHRFICFLELDFGLNTTPPIVTGQRITARGTGVLISPRHVLTAGHCLLSGITKADPLGLRLSSPTRVQSAVVTPGRHGPQPNRSAPITVTDPKAFKVSPQWESSGDSDFDFGLITLPKPFNPDPQFWGDLSRNNNTRITPLADARLKSAAGVAPVKLTTAGYPGSKCFSFLPSFPLCPNSATTGAGQWRGEGEVLGVGTHTISYNIETEGGQSGSPVWLESGGVGSLAAIHTRRILDAQGMRAVGVRLTPAVVSALAKLK